MTAWLSASTGGKVKLAEKRIPELLVPANNLDILKYAVQYGADAVYVGGKRYNLRSIRGNFTVGELKKGIKYAHQKGVRIYLALNAVIHEEDLEGLESYLNKIKDLDIDGIIISDPGLVPLLKKSLPSAGIHISTQSNITNHLAVKAYAAMGAGRVNIAREISFAGLKSIIRNSPIEIEVFVHGALCISYSGRCMLSRYMTGRDANRGECAHSCRWKYYLMEEERPNLFFPVEQDKKGTYIYNSRDLCLLPVLDTLVGSGVHSIKIEGRMKTESYVSLVTWVYRKALDLISDGSFTKKNIRYLMDELDKASHRNFTRGFMFSRSSKELENNDNVGYIKKYDFIGTVSGWDKKYDEPVIMVRNQLKKGDELDILMPEKAPVKLKALHIKDAVSGEEVPVANPNHKVIINGLSNINRYSILRRESNNN